MPINLSQISAEIVFACRFERAIRLWTKESLITDAMSSFDMPIEIKAKCKAVLTRIAAEGFRVRL